MNLETGFSMKEGSLQMVRGRCPEPKLNHRVGNGGQGRNRTIDTRIFNTTESPVRREKAEEGERALDGPTEEAES